MPQPATPLPINTFRVMTRHLSSTWRWKRQKPLVHEPRCSYALVHRTISTATDPEHESIPQASSIRPCSFCNFGLHASDLQATQSSNHHASKNTQQMRSQLGSLRTRNTTVNHRPHVICCCIFHNTSTDIPQRTLQNGRIRKNG
ncbi:hypothetical protein M758_8G026000 [Ceratodon purpureus]|nr:hypothetical protein M758_8G026000 [Ceratodon purpureus]